MSGSNTELEYISSNNMMYCIIARASLSPEKTKFVTSEDDNVQLGYIVYGDGKEIRRHKHLQIKRSLQGTSEVLIIKNGICEIDIYDTQDELIATRQLNCGDVVVILAGGHGFRMLEDTVLIEIKQGPYFGDNEKEYF